MPQSRVAGESFFESFFFWSSAFESLKLLLASALF